MRYFIDNIKTYANVNNGTLVMNTQKYYRRDCVRYWLDGTGLTWKQMYKKGFRCKKVKVSFEIID